MLTKFHKKLEAFLYQMRSLRHPSLFLLQEYLDEAEALVVDLHAVVVEPADAAQEHEQLLARLI